MDQTALFRLSSGLYVIGAAQGGRLNGCVVNTVMQVTAEPIQVTVTINHGNLTCRMIEETGRFTVSMLAQDAPMELIGRFGFRTGRDLDKFDGFDGYALDAQGVPYLTGHCCAMLSCRVVSTTDFGTHLQFAALVEGAANLDGQPPLTYAYYHEVKKGKAPPTAPTYQKEQPAPAPTAAPAGYRCSVCGYVYQGDQLPPGFTCPVCKKGAEVFVRL